MTYTINLNMDMVPILGHMGILTLVTGSTINNMDMESINLLTDLDIKDNLLRGNSMEKGRFVMRLEKMMILLSMLDSGRVHCLMVKVELCIEMVINMMVFLIVVNVVELVLTSSTDILDMKVSGKITVFMDMVNYSVIISYFLKASLSKVYVMV